MDTACKHVVVPSEQTKLSPTQCPKSTKERKEMQNKPYRSLIGALLYAALCTRPDINYIVNVLSRCVTDPGMVHWIAAKRVLRYLHDTPNYGLKYTCTVTPNIEPNKYVIKSYCDSDYGGVHRDRKSTSGYLVFINGNLISWNSKKQKTHALSSTEAEYMALTEVCKELKWLYQLMKELNMVVQLPIYVHCDNTSTIQLSENNVHHDRTKHIDIKYHYIRELVKDKFIEINWVQSSDQLADILTKPLTKVPFHQCRNEIMNLN
jgi:hypothetical protein